MGAECGCSGDPAEAFIVKTKSGEHVLIGVWDSTCPGCYTGPLVMAGILDDEQLEFWKNEVGAKVHNTPEMYGNAFVTLERVEYLEECIGDALNHVLEEHIHDREQCDDVFTKKGTVKAKWKKMEDEIL